MSFLEVHACAGIEHCPPHLLRPTALVNPEQLIKFDKDGNLPIHVAISMWFPFPGDDVSEEDLSLSGTMKSTIGTLIEAQASAARFCNHQDNLPIHLANGSKRYWWEDGIGVLFEALPDAMDVRDREAGLFPFMLAAESIVIDSKQMKCKNK